MLRWASRVANYVESVGRPQRQKHRCPNLVQRRSLLSLTTDLAKVWSAPTTSWTERKDLLELLIADVALTRHETGISVQIRWLTNQVETGQHPLPIRSMIPTPDKIVERIRQIAHSTRCINQHPAIVYQILAHVVLQFLTYSGSWS